MSDRNASKLDDALRAGDFSAERTRGARSRKRSNGQRRNGGTELILSPCKRGCAPSETRPRPVIYGRCRFIGFHARGLARSLARAAYLAYEFDTAQRRLGRNDLHKKEIDNADGVSRLSPRTRPVDDDRAYRSKSARGSRSLSSQLTERNRILSIPIKSRASFLVG